MRGSRIANPFPVMSTWNVPLMATNLYIADECNSVRN